MKNVLAAANRAILDEVLAREVLLAFDYDGTLAPLVADRTKARLRAPTRRLLARVAEQWPCAIISGRSRASVASFVRDLPIRWVIGNHGAEWPGHRAEQAGFRVRSAAWKQAIEPELSRLDGIEIEDKSVSLAVHYRAAPDQRAARRAILRAARPLGECRIVPGIDVVNLVPRGALDKGQALLRLIEESGCSGALFVGDDVTDEDVFGLRGPTAICGVRVGRSKRSRARYYVPDQKRVDDLLRWVLRAGRQSQTGRKART